jgi:hypothetical protein
MAIAVEVLSVSVSANAAGLFSGDMTILLTGDHQSPMEFGAEVIATVHDAPSRAAAIRNGLQQILELADQIKAGATRAIAARPSDG